MRQKPHSPVGSGRRIVMSHAMQRGGRPRAGGAVCGGPLFSCAPPSASPPADLHDTLVAMTSDTNLSRASTAVVRKALEDPQLALVAQRRARQFRAMYGGAAAVFGEIEVPKDQTEMARWLRWWLNQDNATLSPLSLSMKLLDPMLRSCDWATLAAEYIDWAWENPGEPDPDDMIVNGWSEIPRFESECQETAFWSVHRLGPALLDDMRRAMHGWFKHQADPPLGTPWTFVPYTPPVP